MSTQAVQQQSTEFPYFTEEHELIRQTVARFCKEEIAPYAAEWDDEGIFPRELFTKAGALGMFGIRIDPKWGGSGQDWWATAAYVEAWRTLTAAASTWRFWCSLIWRSR